MIKNSSSEDILNWETEAEAIIRDVGEHVKDIYISPKLKSSSCEIFLNLKTLENKDFCIRASNCGFQIVAEEFDQIAEHKPIEDEEEEIFETPYALLNKISPSYVASFANQLRCQLEQLEKGTE